MIRVKDIKISISSKEHSIEKAVARKLKIMPTEILKCTVYKKSIDARNKRDIIFTYTVDVKLRNEKEFQDLIIKKEDTYPEIRIKRDSVFNPVVIGAGPCGLFCAYVLAKEGKNPIIIEQGKTAKERKKDVEKFWNEGVLNPLSNVQFGLGGAGTFSDGKLTTLINNPLCRLVLELFVECGAPKEILSEAKPHLGTDNLINIVENLRYKIEDLGGIFVFNEKVIDVDIDNENVKSILTDKDRRIETDTVVLAIGHSGRDTFELLKSKNVNLEPKAFSVGVRIEHLRSEIDKSQYGDFAGNELLGAADYKFAYHGKDKSAYTFCMCPGGMVVASASEEGHVVTNGMSNFDRDGENSNSAILVSVTPDDFPGDDVLRGMYFQRELESKAFEKGGSNYNAPVQIAEDYINGKVSTKLGNVTPTYKPGYTFADFNEIFPEYINSTLKEGLNDFNKKIKGFVSENAVLTGVETRSSSPVRILRNEEFMSNVNGLYPAGEGAGYAGGIMSSAVDGIRVAIKMLEKE